MSFFLKLYFSTVIIASMKECNLSEKLSIVSSVDDNEIILKMGKAQRYWKITCFSQDRLGYTSKTNNPKIPVAYSPGSQHGGCDPFGVK